ncbi:MAG: hypothetical protein KJ017_11595 [Alphaproteobacteria bacterium]|nr:hypothetical protein [Alphaproteobacteria bacterium]
MSVANIQQIADSFRDGTAATVDLQIVAGQGAQLFNGASNNITPDLTNDGGFGSGPRL